MWIQSWTVPATVILIPAQNAEKQIKPGFHHSVAIILVKTLRGNDTVFFAFLKSLARPSTTVENSFITISKLELLCGARGFYFYFYIVVCEKSNCIFFQGVLEIIQLLLFFFAFLTQ